MRIGEYYQNRDCVEILKDVIREKLPVINGVPNDTFNRDEFMNFFPILAKRLVLHDIFKNKNTWVLEQLVDDIGANPRDAAIKYLKELNLEYIVEDVAHTFKPIEKVDLLYALYGLPEYIDKAYSATIHLYAAEYPKIAERIDSIIAIAKSENEHKTEEIYQRLAELYIDTDLDETVPFFFAVLYSMYQTLQEDFLIPSVCMMSPDVMLFGAKKKMTSVDKVITRLSTGDSNPYATQKLPNAMSKSFAYAEIRLSQLDSMDHWIIKKYLKKRKEALFSALNIDIKNAETTLFQQDLFNQDDKLLALLCEIFHIPKNDLVDAFRYWDSRESLEARKILTRVFIDVYFAIKLKRILDSKSEEELERITTRDIIGSIGMDDIENDVTFFKQILTIVSLFMLANKYRQDYYSIYDFAPSASDSKVLSRSYQKYLAEYRAEIEEKNKIIAKYQDQEKKREIRKSKATEKPLLAEISSLKNIISKKDEEIENLKAQLEEAREYYNLLDLGNKEEVDSEPETYDLSILKDKKIVFVCNDMDSTFPAMKKLFPGSVLVSSDTTQTKAKNVDLVVFFTKFISHSIYFKTKKLYKDVPAYAYNRTNINALKNELARFFATN